MWSGSCLARSIISFWIYNHVQTSSRYKAFCIHNSTTSIVRISVSHISVAIVDEKACVTCNYFQATFKIHDRIFFVFHGLFGRTQQRRCFIREECGAIDEKRRDKHYFSWCFFGSGSFKHFCWSYFTASSYIWWIYHLSYHACIPRTWFYTQFHVVDE